MDVLDLARWQFAITTVYHFFFVPITIGLSAIVAWYHSRWIRTRDEGHLRMAKFLGKLFTINFALGLVTGIVQEFQFGMNWSSYSRFVGDIFGAPLALEALLAFFLESTFLGLWIFGWGRIPERLHAACMWIVHVGTLLSAYFILAANSFMQHPVGYRINPETGRAEMADFVAILTNPVQLVAFPHVITACYLVGGAMVMSVGLFQLRRHTTKGGDATDRRMYRHAARLGAVVVLLGGLDQLLRVQVARPLLRTAGQIPARVGGEPGRETGLARRRERVLVEVLHAPLGEHRDVLPDRGHEPVGRIGVRGIARPGVRGAAAPGAAVREIVG